MNWYFKVLKQYADFNGRASRKEYWMFVLFNFIISIIAVIIDVILELEMEGIGPIFIIYFFVIFIPRIAVGVRRLHDSGKSGWMMLIVLIPMIGIIWYIILMTIDSDFGENQYGEDPKQITV